MNEMKPLKILLGNQTLSLLAGSETWTETLALELKELGHSVHCFSPNLGIVAQRLEDAGISCFSDVSASNIKPYSIVLEEKIEHTYDVIIANHNGIVKYLRSQFPRIPIISTIHGILHEDSDGQIAPEHPALDAGVQQFVSVSEEVQALLRQKYNIDSVIVRNFLDTEHFKSKHKIATKKPRQILFNSNYNFPDDKEVQILRAVAKHYGAKLAAIGENFASAPDVMQPIEISDVVIGMGRSVLEGLSAGRLGIVFGRWGYGGVIHEGNVEQLRSTNFSGRSNEYEGIDVEEKLIEQIDRFYTQAHMIWGRNYILRDHNAVYSAGMYVRMARELLGQPTQEADSRRPYRRARDVQAHS